MLPKTIKILAIISILEFLKKLKMPIDKTAAGIDAETVMPAKSPKYAFAAPKIIDSRIPNIIVLIVILFLSKLSY